MIRFHCPQCESQMEVDESFAGRAARCPTCGFGMKVPKQGEPSTPVAPAAAPPRQGAPTVRIDGQKVEVLPPLETMVVVSMVFVAIALVAPLIIGLALGSLFQYPWTVAATIGALAALLGVMVAVPGYYNVRRSRGRRRGRAHAVMALGVGGGLFIVQVIGALAGFAANVWLRPTCEQNLEHIYTALRAYADKHDGAFPAGLDALVEEKHLDNPRWLTCPAYAFQVGKPTYILTPDVNIKNPLFPKDLMIISDGPPYNSHEDGRVRYVLLSGDIKSIEHTKWDALRKAQVERWNAIMNQIREPDKVAAQKRAEAEAAKEKEEGDGGAEPQPPAGAPKANAPPQGPAKEAAP